MSATSAGFSEPSSTAAAAAGHTYGPLTMNPPVDP
jgi:hypothetical protein